MKKRLLPLLCACLLAPTLAPITAGAEDLMQVYRLALDNDPQLRAARATRDSALENRPLARSRLLPSVGVGADANWIYSDIKGSGLGSGSDTFGQGALSLSLSQPLYRRDYTIQVEQADQQIAMAEAQFAAEEQGLMVRASNAYLQVLLSNDLLESAKAENAAIARQLEQAKQRYEVGLIAITAVHEAQAAYDQSNADLIKAENDVANAWEALREIIRVEMDELAILVDPLPLESPDPKDIEQWAESAQQQNLAIRAALHGVEVARQNVDLQRAGDAPTLELVGSQSFDRTSSDRSSDSDQTVVGLRFNMPLYTGGGVQAATRQAGHDLTAAQEKLDQQRRATNREVRDAYRAVLASISAVEALKAGLVSTKSALEATEAGYDVGTRTMVDVLNAEQNVFSARSRLSSVRVSYVMSRLKLKQGTGTLSEEDLQQVNGWLKH